MIARIEHDDKVINSICVPDFGRVRAVAAQVGMDRYSAFR